MLGHQAAFGIQDVNKHSVIVRQGVVCAPVEGQG
jgi:hypothetical protein